MEWLESLFRGISVSGVSTSGHPGKTTPRNRRYARNARVPTGTRRPKTRPESQAELMTCAENPIQAENQDGNDADREAQILAAIKLLNCGYFIAPEPGEKGCWCVPSILLDVDLTKYDVPSRNRDLRRNLPAEQNS